ncbi:MAG: TonB family protein [Methylotenera sp.]
MANTLKLTEAKALAALITKLKTLSMISIAIWLSVMIHAVILSIHFEPELKKLAEQLPTLDVMLVNAKTKTKPVKADVLAQANLDRGGNTDQDRVMKSALPAVKQQKTEFTLKPTTKEKSGARAAKKVAEETQEEKRVTELERKAQELMTQIKATKKVESQPLQASTAKASETGDQEAPSKLNMADMTASALEIDKLEAAIAKKQDDYQKRPKRKELGARAQEYRFTMYEEVCRQKIEKFGNLNYPEAMRDKNAFGKVLFSIDIKADGSIEKIVIKRSSGNKIFDEAAKNILQLAAPYPEFPPDIRKEFDVIGITRTMTFTREDTLQAE